MREERGYMAIFGFSRQTYGKKAATYVNDSFKTYLMFRPGQGENSVWVPLSRINWGWQGVVHQVDKGSL